MPAFFRIPAIVCVFIILLWCAGLLAFSVHIKGIAPPGSVHTDAIIVLTGGPDRINTGLDLLEARQAEYLFISGVNTDVSVEQLVALWRKDHTAPPCCVVLGHFAKNTFENAAEARDWVGANNIASARLLTADYHMPRARLAFRSALPQMKLYPHPIASPKANWSIILDEYNKTLFTMFKFALTKAGL